MTESICYPDDDPFRRHRYYLIWIGQRVCARLLNREILERFAQIVLRIFIEEKAEISKELSQDDLFFLAKTLCSVMSKEIDSKKLLEIIATWTKGGADAKFAADKSYHLFYERHYELLKESVKRFCSNKPQISNGEREEVVQQVFFIVYLNAGKFKAKSANHDDFDEMQRQVQVWLSRIGKNLVLQICMKKGIEFSIETLTTKADDDPDIPDWDGLTLTHSQADKETKKAEETLYDIPVSDGSDLDWEEDNELCKKLAHKVLSGRDLKIYLASIENYVNEQQRNRRMKKLDLELNIKPNTRSKSISRSRKKIWKCVEDATARVLSGIELDIFLSLIKQYKYDNNKKEKEEKKPVEENKEDEKDRKETVEENQKDEKKPVKKEEKKGKAEREAIEQKEKREKILRELKDKYGKTAAEINKIYDDNRRKVKNYLEPVLQNEN